MLNNETILETAYELASALEVASIRLDTLGCLLADNKHINRFDQWRDEAKAETARARAVLSRSAG